MGYYGEDEQREGGVMVEDVKKKIAELLDQLETTPVRHGKIGIGITTHNRMDMFARCYAEMVKHKPQGSRIVVVDDASTEPIPNADYRFAQNAGIAKAKNKCLELLYLDGCEHFFLFDDDTWPMVKEWWKPYVESAEPHLNYIFQMFASGRNPNDTIELYRNDEIVAYSHVRGCMMYYRRDALERVGGMDPVFGKWGYEHPSLSDRIYMAGLTSFRYMDVVGSKGLIYSDDEHNDNVNTTVGGSERQQQIARNAQLYQDRRYSSDFIPFIEKRNILLTCYFTRVPDPQASASDSRDWPSNADALMPLMRSLKDTKLVVLHDCLDVENTDKVEFVRVPTSLNPYFQRWISYRRYLMDNANTIENVFCIDGTDVEVLNEPEWSELGDWLYVGDENTALDDAAGWMRLNHSQPSIKAMLDKHGKRYQMLNAGIVGGKVEMVGDFIRELVDFYCFAMNDAFFHDRPDAGNTDMGAFNYIARTKFGHRIRSGGQVCTRFKAEERNDYSWFKHK